jgi:hypothetical protein
MKSWRGREISEADFRVTIYTDLSQLQFEAEDAMEVERAAELAADFSDF